MAFEFKDKLVGERIVLKRCKYDVSLAKNVFDVIDAEADYVIVPHLLGGDHASLLIEQFGGDMDKLIEHKLTHIEELKSRQ